MFPIEPGTWGATPEAMRRKFGKQLLIVGGFDKLALEKGRNAISSRPARRWRTISTISSACAPCA
jgi:hypothetical protein